MKKILFSLTSLIFVITLLFPNIPVLAADSEEYAYTKDAVDFMTNEKELQSLISYIKKQIKLLKDDSYKSTLENALDASIKSNISGARAQAELFYDSNGNEYKGFCKSDEISRMNSSLEKKSKVTCTDSKTAYRISATLSNKKLFCADSTGAVLIVKKLKKNSFVCK